MQNSKSPTVWQAGQDRCMTPEYFEEVVFVQSLNLVNTKESKNI